MDIRFITRDEIDKVKWNSCIHYATNGNIYGYVWYLDQIAKDWHALVEGDYESVFPLIWKEDLLKRKELYQPGLMRESGIYSIHLLSEKRVQRFLEAIPEEYKKINIALNEQNRPGESLSYAVEEKTNYQLFLNQPYEKLVDQYTTDVMKQLQIAEDEGIVLTSSIKPEQIADYYLKYQKGATEEQFHGLQRIMYNILHRGWGFASAAMAPDTEVLAVNFFIYSHKKIVNLVPVSTPRGEQVGALPYLMNGIIRSHANKPIILDFNESGNQIAKEFGARPNAYFHLKENRRILGVL